MAGHIASSSSVDWNTPEEILTPVRALFAADGGIHLDPCSNPGSLVGARESFSLPNVNGLKAPWFTDTTRTAYVNPPFGTYSMHRESRDVLLPKQLKAQLDKLPKADVAAFKAQYERCSLKDWLTKTAREIASNPGSQAVVCCPAGVGTWGWQATVFPSCSAICWMQGRPWFVGAEAGSPMDCALVYWGPHIVLFRKIFASVGHVSPPRFVLD